MPRTVLRCHNCGSRAEVELSQSEAESLRRVGYINRACRECAGVSHWELHESAEAGHSAAASVTDSPGLILIVDDDESLLTVLSKALTRMKYDVHTAHSARSALTLLARHDFDVILSDIRMPDFDGKALLAFLQEHMPDARDRVVFITGDVGNPKTMDFIERERLPYVAKPLDIPALVNTIRAVQAGVAVAAGGESAPVAQVVESPPAAPPPVPHSDTEQALSYAILMLRQEANALKRTLEERNAEVEALRKELARRESEGRPQAGDAAAELERHRAEASEQRKKAEAAGEEAAAARQEAAAKAEAAKRLQKELDDARARLAGAESAKRASGKATEEFTRRQAELHQQVETAVQERDLARTEAEGWRRKAEEAAAEWARIQESLRQQLQDALQARDKLHAEVEKTKAQAGEAEEWQRKAAEAAAESARIRGDLHQQLQDALRVRDKLRAEVEKGTEQAADAGDWKNQLAEAEAAAQAAREELELVRGQHGQLAAEAQRARDAAAEANDDRERLERELSVFRGKESAAGELHGQLAALEGELEQAKGELARMRKELTEQQAPPLTPEAVAAAGKVSPETRAALEREAQRGGARWEAMQTELEGARTRAHRLESILRHFYVASVNPLTVAVATADLAAGSQWLNPRDKETLQLLKQNIDTIIESIKVLKKQMRELEIDIK